MFPHFHTKPDANTLLFDGIHYKMAEHKNAFTKTTISAINKQLVTCQVMFKIVRQLDDSQLFDQSSYMPNPYHCQKNNMTLH